MYLLSCHICVYINLSVHYELQISDFWARPIFFVSSWCNQLAPCSFLLGLSLAIGTISKWVGSPCIVLFRHIYVLNNVFYSNPVFTSNWSSYTSLFTTLSQRVVSFLSVPLHVSQPDCKLYSTCLATLPVLSIYTTSALLHIMNLRFTLPLFSLLFYLWPPFYPSSTLFYSPRSSSLVPSRGLSEKLVLVLDMFGHFYYFELFWSFPSNKSPMVPTPAVADLRLTSITSSPTACTKSLISMIRRLAASLRVSMFGTQIIYIQNSWYGPFVTLWLLLLGGMSDACVWMYVS